MRRLHVLVPIATLAIAAGCDDSTGPRKPAQIAAASNVEVQVTAGAAVADSARVRVSDEKGKGVANVQVTWSTSDAQVAAVATPITVTNAEGYAAILPIATTRAGAAVVRANTLIGSASAQVDFTVRVAAANPVSLTAAPGGRIGVRIGGVQPITLSALDAYGNAAPTTSAAWSSSNTGAVEVSPGGVVTGKAEGSGTVRATLGTLEANVQVDVATVLFSDNFDSENGGRHSFVYSGLQKWSFAAGRNVDLIGAGSAYDYFPGNGLYIDLDGFYESSTIRTNRVLDLTPGTYVLRFLLAGSQRGDANTVTVSLGTAFSETFTLESAAPLTEYRRTITVQQLTSAPLTFAHRRDNLPEGDNGFGVILDDVSVTRQ